MKKYTDDEKKEINKIDVVKRTGLPATYEALAEEATELAKAALKCARVLRKESYTPLTYDDCKTSLIEEFSDVICCANVLGLEPKQDIVDYKLFRWKQRIHEYLK